MSDFVSECLADDVKEAIELMPSIVAIVREKEGWRGFETIEDVIEYYEDDKKRNSKYWKRIHSNMRYL